MHRAAKSQTPIAIEESETRYLPGRVSRPVGISSMPGAPPKNMTWPNAKQRTR